MKIKFESQKKEKAPSTFIELGTKAFKVLHLDYQEHKKIFNLWVHPLKEQPSKEFSLLLEDILRKKKFKIPSLILSLERSQVTIRFVKLPTTQKKEISRMVLWEAARALPYRLEEIVVDYQILEIDKQGFTQTLLIILPRATLQDFIKVCEEKKIFLRRVTLSSEGLAKWYLNKIKDRGPVAIIDIEAETTEIVILWEEKFIFSRRFSWAEDSFKTDKPGFLREIELSLDAYRKLEIYKPFKKIFLISSKREESGELASFLSRHFSLPVEIREVLKESEEGYRLHPSPGVEDFSFASLLGLAFNPYSLKINLLPPGKKEAILISQRREKFFLTGILFLLFIFILGLSVGVIFYKKKAILRNLEEELLRVKPLAEEVLQAKKRLQFIHKNLLRRSSPLDILRELYQITPGKVYLNTFIYEEERLVIKGISPTRSLVFNFVSKLKDFSYFGEVQARYVRARKLGETSLIEFELVCLFRRNLE